LLSVFYHSRLHCHCKALRAFFKTIASSPRAIAGHVTPVTVDVRFLIKS